MEMKTLIVYATKYGSAEKCAGKLKEDLALSGEVECLNLKRRPEVDLNRYDTVIIGGSIHMGGIQKEVKAFCSAHLDTLLKKRVGLFICCMRDGEIADSELAQAFPQELLAHAEAKDYFGGEFIFKRMNLLDRLIVRKVSKVEQDTSTLSEEKIQAFARKMLCA